MDIERTVDSGGNVTRGDVRDPDEIGFPLHALKTFVTRVLPMTSYRIDDSRAALLEDCNGGLALQIP